MTFFENEKVILASASKVRAELLKNAGVAFETETPNVDEDEIKKRESRKSTADIALALAFAKAIKVSKTVPEKLVIGADQIMEFDKVLYDKPTSKRECINRLKAMRGKPHNLVSAVCVVKNGEVLWSFVDNVTLTIRNVSDKFILNYINYVADDALSSVGAYKLENVGAQLFTKVEGDFFSVLGLPLLPLLEFLRSQKVLCT